MSSLLEALQGTMGPGTVSSLSRQLGTDSNATGNALGAVLPLMLEALTRNASSPEGAASLHGALARDHDGSVLDDLQGYVDRPNLAAGDGILGHVFGNRRSAVEQGIGLSSGLDAGDVAKLMATVAPLVMAYLGRRQRESGLDSAGLGRALGEERDRAVAAEPVLGGLASILDADDDGSVVDDLMRLGGKLFR